MLPLKTALSTVWERLYVRFLPWEPISSFAFLYFPLRCEFVWRFLALFPNMQFAIWLNLYTFSSLIDTKRYGWLSRINSRAFMLFWQNNCLYALNWINDKLKILSSQFSYLRRLLFNNKLQSTPSQSLGGVASVWHIKLFIGHKLMYPKLDKRISGLCPSSVTLVLPPLDSETSCTGELWSNRVLVKLEN